MDKAAEEKLVPKLARICELKNTKERAEKELKKLETDVKAELNRLKIVSGKVGKYQVELTKVAGSLIVDTDKIKADKLFEKYSKMKAGYEKLTIIDPDDGQGAARRDRQAQAIEAKEATDAGPKHP